LFSLREKEKREMSMLENIEYCGAGRPGGTSGRGMMMHAEH
jgi:hypothetical protein